MFPNKEKRRKLDPHAKKCIFTGYGEASSIKAYKLFDLHTQKFLFSPFVTFDEAMLMTQHTNHEVHLNEKSNNELTFPSDSHIVNYGGPITRDRSTHSRRFESQRNGESPKINKLKWPQHS